ncbi:MAG: TlyA family RNA methyltransferase [Eubacteriales bacterium]
MRLDIYLHEHGFAESRARAKALITSGCVYVNGKNTEKPSYEVSEETLNIELRGDVCPYVSRGGLKLEGALEAFSIALDGITAADIGASTGGFTDCMLSRGAAKVYAIDCGTSQLHPKLRDDGRVVNIDNFNAREIDENTLPERCGIAVMDVSFISQRKLYANVISLLCDDGAFISLIKPQFEVGRGGVGKNGIVRDAALHKQAVRDCVSAAAAFNLILFGLVKSPIAGGDGNIEYLAYFRYKPTSAPPEVNINGVI